MNNRYGMTASAGAFGAGLGAMFGGNENPYDAGQQYYNKIPGMLGQYYNPYIQQGQQMGGRLGSQYGSMTGGLPGLEAQYGQMVNDPNAVMNKVGSGYQQSPGFQWQLNQGMNAANNAAAAGGMVGSPQHQQQAATMANGLANQDYYNYLNAGLGVYGAGLQGQQGLFNQGLAGEQGMWGTGYNASGQMAGGLGTNYMNQGNMAFAGQAAQNQANGQMWGNLFGGAVGMGMFSSQALKEKTSTPTTKDILNNVRDLSLDRWKYKGINQEFIGPYAEEFTDRFGVGDGKTINLIDAIGVLIGSIKELDKRIASLESKGI